MTTLQERELTFIFPPDWNAEQFDSPGRVWPKHIAPVDFIVERVDDILLIEVKDPSNSKASDAERKKFIAKMQSNELTHQELAPKARTSWSVLHLMNRTSKPLRYVAVLGVDALSVQPVLLQSLTDRLKKRLAQEMDAPWKVTYITSVVVIAALDLGNYLPGVSVTRQSSIP